MNSTTMVEFTPRTRTSRTGEPRRNANTGECLGYEREVRQAGCQRNRVVESSRLKVWLPRNAVFQRPLRLYFQLVSVPQVSGNSKLLLHGLFRASSPKRLGPPHYKWPLLPVRYIRRWRHLLIKDRGWALLKRYHPPEGTRRPAEHACRPEQIEKPRKATSVVGAISACVS